MTHNWMKLSKMNEWLSCCWFFSSSSSSMFASLFDSVRWIQPDTSEFVISHLLIRHVSTHISCDLLQLALTSPGEGWIDAAGAGLQEKWEFNILKLWKKLKQINPQRLTQMMKKRWAVCKNRSLFVIKINVWYWCEIQTWSQTMNVTFALQVMFFVF